MLGVRLVVSKCMVFGNEWTQIGPKLSATVNYAAFRGYMELKLNFVFKSQRE